MSLIDRLFTSPLLLLIRGYQLSLSLLIGRQCRFEPSCSHYMTDAIREHGVLKGVAMGTGRVARCHPWNEGGFDPVPPKVDSRVNRGCCSQSSKSRSTTS